VSSIIFQVQENLEGVDLASSQHPPTAATPNLFPHGTS